MSWSAAGRIGRLQAVQSWFSYFNDDPTNIRNIRDAGGGALIDIGCYNVNLSRMLFGAEPERVQASLVRDPDMASTSDERHPRVPGRRQPTFTCSIRSEDDQRVHIYGTEGHISIGIPFNIPPDRPTQIFVTPGGEPPVAPAIETLTFETADPYAVEAEPSPPRSSTASRCRSPPDDAVAQHARHRAGLRGGRGRTGVTGRLPAGTVAQ